MKWYNQFDPVLFGNRVKHEQDGGGGSGGQGGQGGSGGEGGNGQQGGQGGGAINWDDPAIKAELDKRMQGKIDEVTKGLKSKNSELLGELKSVKEKMQNYDGIDPNEVREMFSKLEAEEDKKLLKDGKLDELLSKRTDRMRSDYEKKLKGSSDALKAKDEEINALQSKLSEVLIDGAIREEAGKAGIIPSAMRDAISRGREIFRLEEGKIVPRDGEELKMGKDGKNAMSISEWVDALKEDAPHFFSAQGGSGSGGSGGRATGQVDTSKMSVDEYAKAYEEGRV